MYTPMFHTTITYNGIAYWSRYNIAKLQEIIKNQSCLLYPTSHQLHDFYRFLPSKASPTRQDMRTSRWTMRKWPISTRISRGTCKTYLASTRAFCMLMDSKPPDTTKRDKVNAVCSKPIVEKTKVLMGCQAGFHRG